MKTKNGYIEVKEMHELFFEKLETTFELLSKFENNIGKLQEYIAKFLVWEMERWKVSRAELARRLSCNRACVTRFLSKDGNLTLETVSRIYKAIREKKICK